MGKVISFDMYRREQEGPDADEAEPTREGAKAKIVGLKADRAKRERKQLAKDIRAFERNVVFEAAALWVPPEEFDDDPTHKRRLKALLSTSLGQAVADLAKHAARMAWILEHTK